MLFAALLKIKYSLLYYNLHYSTVLIASGQALERTRGRGVRGQIVLVIESMKNSSKKKMISK